MAKKVTAALLISLLTVAYPVSAAEFHWEFAGWYGGGNYPNIEFDPNIKDRVYLVSDVSGIWRSDDRGERWNFINRGLEKLNVALLAVAPSDSNVLYAGTTAGLYRSLNTGGDWELCNTDGGRVRFESLTSYRSIAVSATDPTALAVGTKGGEVVFSKDGGSTWSPLGSNLTPLGKSGPLTSLSWSQDGSRLYAASAAGLAVHSLNDGKWKVLEKAPKNISDFLIHASRLYVVGQESISISEDEGKTWQSTSKIPQGKTSRAAFVSTGKGPSLLAGWVDGWHGEIVRSEDGGKSWAAATQKMTPNKTHNPTRVWAEFKTKSNALKTDPFDSAVVFRTDSWGVWRSDDGGATWNEKVNGAPNTVGSDIAVADDGTIYAATMDDGLLKSSDGGKNYEPLFPSKGFQKEINGHVWRVLAAGDGKVIATSSPWNKNINQVIVSGDGGKSFEIVMEGLPSKRPKANTMWWEGFARALASDPKNSNTFYLGIDGDDGGGFFISHDGGRHWICPKAQPAGKRIYNALAVDPTATNRLFWGAYGKNGGIYMNEKAGGPWKLVFSAMSKVFDLAITKEGTLYAGGEESGACLYQSRDHGKSWRLLKKFSEKGSVEAITVLSEDGKKLALSTHQWDELAGGKIFYSNDAGESWADITGDLPPGSGMASIAYNSKEGILYGIRYAGSVYRLDIQ